MKRTMIVSFAVLGVLVLTMTAFAGIAEAKRPGRAQLYYEGELVDALIPTKGDGSSVTFKEMPEKAKSYPFDPIYVFVDSETEMPHAQPPVIGDAPGDSSYNGGRWQVFLVFGTTADDDDITSVDDLMDSGLTIEETNMYFICPVIGK